MTCAFTRSPIRLTRSFGATALIWPSCRHPHHGDRRNSLCTRDRASQRLYRPGWAGDLRFLEITRHYVLTCIRWYRVVRRRPEVSIERTKSRLGITAPQKEGVQHRAREAVK